MDERTQAVHAALAEENGAWRLYATLAASSIDVNVEVVPADEELHIPEERNLCFVRGDHEAIVNLWVLVDRLEIPRGELKIPVDHYENLVIEKLKEMRDKTPVEFFELFEELRASDELPEEVSEQEPVDPAKQESAGNVRTFFREEGDREAEQVDLSGAVMATEEIASDHARAAESNTVQAVADGIKKTLQVALTGGEPDEDTIKIMRKPDGSILLSTFGQSMVIDPNNVKLIETSGLWLSGEPINGEITTFDQRKLAILFRSVVASPYEPPQQEPLELASKGKRGRRKKAEVVA